MRTRELQARKARYMKEMEAAERRRDALYLKAKPYMDAALKEATQVGALRTLIGLMDELLGIVWEAPTSTTAGSALMIDTAAAVRAGVLLLPPEEPPAPEVDPKPEAATTLA